jgi:hypothetical protein
MFPHNVLFAVDDRGRELVLASATLVSMPSGNPSFTCSVTA